MTINGTINGHVKPKRQVSESARLKQELAVERMRREIVQEKVTRRMLEQTTYGGEDGGPRYIHTRDVAEPPGPGERVITQGQTERKLPFSNLQDLANIRDAARYLADENVYTCGMLGVLESYIVGTGFGYRVVAKERHEVAPELIQKAQDVIDEFIDRTHWWEWEKELFRRAHRDGEEARRYGVTDGKLWYRPIEPEHIVDPPSIKANDPEWCMGVRRNAQDPYTIMSYWVSYNGTSASGVEVPAVEVDHNKANVDRCIPRGLSDFFCIRDIAPDLLKLINNVSRGAQVLAAIAWIESQAAGTLKPEVEAMAMSEADWTQTNPNNNQTQYFQHLMPGSRIRTNAGKSYNPAPLAQNTMNFVEIVRLGRQAMGVRWSGHEVLTGDASNGSYSSLLVAESPFVHRAVSEQQVQANAHRTTMFRALRVAEAAGLLPTGLCKQIDVEVEPAAITGRNGLVEAQTDQAEQGLGIVSPQTLADKRGYNFEREQEQIQKAKALGWTGAAPAGPMVLSAREAARERDPFAWLRGA